MTVKSTLLYRTENGNSIAWTLCNLTLTRPVIAP